MTWVLFAWATVGVVLLGVAASLVLRDNEPRSYKLRLLAYIGLAVAMALGFWHIEQVRERGDRNLCAFATENRAFMKNVLTFPQPPTGPAVPGVPPDLAEAVERSLEARSERLRAYALERLPTLPCDEVVGSP